MKPIQNINVREYLYELFDKYNINWEAEKNGEIGKEVTGEIIDFINEYFVLKNPNEKDFTRNNKLIIRF